MSENVKMNVLFLNFPFLGFAAVRNWCLFVAQLTGMSEHKVDWKTERFYIASCNWLVHTQFDCTELQLDDA